MKRILSGVLRRKDGVERRNGGPERFGWNSLDGAGTSRWVLNGFLELTVPIAAGELAR